ncbi:MAG: hypothetical protein V3T56_01790 [Gemmatimonadales bacterium]
MKRRDFFGALGAPLLVGGFPSRARAPLDRTLLIPMDESQTDHLKAYGIAYRALEGGATGEWLLNYRNGSFLLDDSAGIRREAALAGVTFQQLSGTRVVDLRGEIAANNMESVLLEKAPKVAVYAPPGIAPWDDAVTMALQYAGIEYETIWDREVVDGELSQFEWLHLHHEDFTGQYSKFYLTYRGSAWLEQMVRLNQGMARSLGFPHVPALKKDVAEKIRTFVEHGKFLFAMCTATETLELALAASDADIAAQYSDGSPMDPNADQRMRWDRSLAFQNARLEHSPMIASFSDIDGHQVNNPVRRQQLGAFKLFDFAAKIDPVPTMLVQNHREVIPDFYGLTTSFARNRLKPGVTVLADEQGAPWVKYIHGELGEGTWTFLGGHDPEDPQHQIGDPPTDLSLHTNSPGYRLILNNVLFPAAKKRELKT